MGRLQRTAIDVTRNPSSARDAKSPSNVNEATAVEKNLATEDQDNDLTSKIRYSNTFQFSDATITIGCEL